MSKQSNTNGDKRFSLILVLVALCIVAICLIPNYKENTLIVIRSTISINESPMLPNMTNPPTTNNSTYVLLYTTHRCNI